MTAIEIQETVQDIMRSTLELKDLIISESTNADDIEEWDSFAHLSLIMAIEKEFNINFALGEIQDMQHVGDLLHLIDKKLK